MLGATAFSKQETVFFDELVAGFDDMLTFGRNVAKFQADATVLERSPGHCRDLAPDAVHLYFGGWRGRH